MPDTAKRPDRAEIAKRVERAEKYLQKGKTVDALTEFLAVLEEDPENDSVRQMAADLSLSLNRTAEAVKLLGQLYDRQLTSSDVSRATLTYKRLARLVNPTWEQKMRFAQLVEQSNKKLSLETYEAAFIEVTKLGRKQEALSIVKRIVELDATQANLLRLGELCSQLNDHKGAASAFARIAQIQETEGKNAGQWYERAYTEDASDSAIVLAYGKSLLNDRQVGAAIFVLEPQILAGNASEELREAYGRALLAANRLVDAEPIIWEIFEQHPVRIQQVLELIGSMIDCELDKEAVALARKLEQFQRRRGERKTFVNQMQEISTKHRACPEVLEFLSELFNSSNKESDYAQTLLKLFDLYCSVGNYQKAGECLDRAAEVDPYESGHQKRLEMLRGRIDENRFQVIASRFTSATKADQQPSRSEEVTLGTAALQDLMLQAEILVQYGMKTKAIERLQRIQELFPHEEDRNEDLQRLYIAAGMTPKYAGSAPVPSASVPSKAPSAVVPPAPQSNDNGDVSSFTKVAEITRKLYKQSTASAVLTTAVNEIGAHWEATRCVAAMRKPGLPPTAVEEYSADGVEAADSASMAKLVALLHDLAMNRGTLSIPDALAAPELQPVRPILAELAVTSLLALPLSDGQEQVGVLLLTHSTPRGWHSSDLVVLKTIAEQITIALNNAGLRRLVKNLSVTDESSGLLNRASYLDLLQAEIRRGLQQATPLTVLLMKFGKHLSKESGDKGTDTVMQQISKLIAANIRQNDLAFRYDTTTVAVVLGETGEKESLLAVEKLRKLFNEVHPPGKDHPVSFAAGLAQAVMKQQYDPVDIVTELINRAEQALEGATTGPNKVVALAPTHAAAAVA
ncbi:MAG TPA: diguanylate cyclase [Terriglobales bacterium]|nr:diguanylate cyclase [Terriglobales bacterium]